MAYPAAIPTFATVAGTTLFTADDHAAHINSLGSASAQIATALGTNAGTSVLKNFVAGDFAARVANETFTGGTFSGVGTFTGGSISNMDFGATIKLHNSFRDPYNNIAFTFNDLGGSIATDTNRLVLVAGTGPAGTPGITATGTASNINISVKGLGTGVTVLGTGNLKFPNVDGSVGQAVITDGAKNLSFPSGNVFTRQSAVHIDNGTAAYKHNTVMIPFWGFATGNGTQTFLPTSGPGSIAFGFNFTTPPKVIINSIGYKDGSDPTSEGDFTSGLSEINWSAVAGTTGFQYYGQQINATAPNNGRRTGFSGFVIGLL